MKTPGVITMSWKKLVKRAPARVGRAVRGLVESHQGRAFHARQLIDIATREAFRCVSIRMYPPSNAPRYGCCMMKFNGFA
jgi:hypothetical protein